MLTAILAIVIFLIYNGTFMSTSSAGMTKGFHMLVPIIGVYAFVNMIANNVFGGFRSWIDRGVVYILVFIITCTLLKRIYQYKYALIAASITSGMAFPCVVIMLFNFIPKGTIITELILPIMVVIAIGFYCQYMVRTTIYTETHPKDGNNLPLKNQRGEEIIIQLRRGGLVPSVFASALFALNVYMSCILIEDHLFKTILPDINYSVLNYFLVIITVVATFVVAYIIPEPDERKFWSTLDEIRPWGEVLKNKQTQTQNTYENRTDHVNDTNSNNPEVDYFKNCKTKADLEKAYKRLSQVYHPDSPTGDEATFKIINEQHENKLKELA